MKWLKLLNLFDFQVISFENWETQTPVAEQQRITFEMSNGSVSSQVDIKFGFAGAFTGRNSLFKGAIYYFK